MTARAARRILVLLLALASPLLAGSARADAYPALMHLRMDYFFGQGAASRFPYPDSLRIDALLSGIVDIPSSQPCCMGFISNAPLAGSTGTVSYQDQIAFMFGNPNNPYHTGPMSTPIMMGEVNVRTGPLANPVTTAQVHLPFTVLSTEERGTVGYTMDAYATGTLTGMPGDFSGSGGGAGSTLCYSRGGCESGSGTLRWSLHMEIPEPATAMLLGAGLLAFLAVAMRRARRAVPAPGPAVASR